MESRGGVLCNVSESVRFWLLADLFDKATLRPLSSGKQNRYLRNTFVWVIGP